MRVQELNEMVRIFDLKGSTFKRETMRGNFSKSETLKDIDFLKMKVHVNLPEENLKEINQIIELDVKFLRENQLMDYSILLGIELANKTLKGAKGNRRLCLSKCGKYIYHICIIDYLQTFNLAKRGEIFLKTVFENAKANTLSAIDPDRYASRFIDFMKSKVFNP